METSSFPWEHTLTISFVAICILLIWYGIQFLQTGIVQESTQTNECENRSVRRRETASQRGKKKTETRWTRDKQPFNHPWLLTSLKGHSGQVLDMDFSSNEKYLATCGEEEVPNTDPSSDVTNTSSASSTTSNESKDECTNPQSAQTNPVSKGLSRRQRKNRRREDTSPPEGRRKPRAPRKPPATSSTVAASAAAATATVTPLPIRQSLKVNLAERDLAILLRSYLLSPEQMATLGYPISCGLGPGKAIIFKAGPPRSRVNITQSRFDVNAREFVPKSPKPDWTYANDSGNGSGSSSDSGDSEGESTPLTAPRGDEHKCARCGRPFLIASGVYLTHDQCIYHWGRLQRGTHAQEYACCRGVIGSRGCTTARLHVWNGISNGMNALDAFVRTRARRSPPPDGNFGVYALDCEMCYTAAGLELAKVTVIGHDARLVYDSYVRPENEIIDYNTRWSGITAKDLGKRACAKTLREVQNDLMGFISADTILIGHGLENDLRALRIVHSAIVDTAVTFPHYHGLPFRRSLKSLTSFVLGREIQIGPSHNSYEDAHACMELMLWRVRKDFRLILDHYYYQS